jgi:membrane fusion protein (multidrug efflux system)
VVQTGQAIYIITDLSHVWVTANFEETKIRLIHPNIEADITIDAYPNRVFPGKVIQVGTDIVPPPLSIGDSTKTTQKIPVKIKFDDPSVNRILTPGMSVEVKIRVK